MGETGRYIIYRGVEMKRNEIKLISIRETLSPLEQQRVEIYEKIMEKRCLICTDYNSKFSLWGSCLCCLFRAWRGIGGIWGEEELDWNIYISNVCLERWSPLWQRGYILGYISNPHHVLVLGLENMKKYLVLRFGVIITKREIVIHRISTPDILINGYRDLVSYVRTLEMIREKKHPYPLWEALPSYTFPRWSVREINLEWGRD